MIYGIVNVYSDQCPCNNVNGAHKYFVFQELGLPFGQRFEFSRLWFEKYHGKDGKIRLRELEQPRRRLQRKRHLKKAFAPFSVSSLLFQLVQFVKF